MILITIYINNPTFSSAELLAVGLHQLTALYLRAKWICQVRVLRNMVLTHGTPLLSLDLTHRLKLALGYGHVLYCTVCAAYIAAYALNPGK